MSLGIGLRQLFRQGQHTLGLAGRGGHAPGIPSQRPAIKTIGSGVDVNALSFSVEQFTQQAFALRVVRMNQIGKRVRPRDVVATAHHLLQGWIECGDAAITVTLQQTERSVFEPGTQFRFRTLRPAEFSNSTHIPTLRAKIPGRNQRSGGLRPSFSQNGNRLLRLVERSTPISATIESRACAAEGQMSLKREIFTIITLTKVENSLKMPGGIDRKSVV